MKLYSYWRSTTSYRVRAALNLKQIEYDLAPVDLLKGEHKSADYVALNPNAGVPTLLLDDGTAMVQSLAILEYLDMQYPEPRLFPEDAMQRAKVLEVAHTVAMDIHPVNNMRVIGELKTRFEASADVAQSWMQHWMSKGFEAVEQLLPDGDGFAFGNHPDVADLCIVAQVYNAHRWGLDMGPFPKITRIEKNCLNVPGIDKAHPDNQPDAKVTT